MYQGLSINTLIGLAFSLGMSEDDFVTFMKNKGVSDMDASKVTGKYNV